MAWHDIAAIEDIPAGRGWPVRALGHKIVVYLIDEKVYALENRCVHNGNPIDDGPVEEGIVTCPWHGWTYDVTTGEQLTMWGKVRGLATWPAKAEGGRILVDVEA